MPGIAPVYGLPGVRAAKTATHRLLFRGGPLLDILPGGKIIAGACSRDPGNTSNVDVLRAGLLMGKISTVVNSLGTANFYAPSVIGVTTNAEAIGATTIESAAAVATEIVRRCGATGTFKLVGPAAANGAIQSETVTYSAINTTSGDITATAIVNAYVAGSFICPTDGSETPITFIPDSYGVKVTDEASANLDVPYAELPIGGVINSDQVLPVWPSDTSLRTWIINRINDVPGGKFQWTHYY